MHYSAPPVGVGLLPDGVVYRMVRYPRVVQFGAGDAGVLRFEAAIADADDGEGCGGTGRWEGVEPAGERRVQRTVVLDLPPVAGVRRKAGDAHLRHTLRVDRLAGAVFTSSQADTAAVSAAPSAPSSEARRVGQAGRER